MKFVMLLAALTCSAFSLGQVLSQNTPYGKLEVRAVAPDVVCFKLYKSHPKPTEMLDTRGLRRGRSVGRLENGELSTGFARVKFYRFGISIQAPDISLNVEIRQNRLSGPSRAIGLTYPPHDKLYGIRGISLSRTPPYPGIERFGDVLIKAGSQGDGGAPLVYSTHWGMLVDTIDGQISKYGGGSLDLVEPGDNVEAYIILGPPKRTIEVATDLTGHSPMPPKWTLGFMNSQWGTTQQKVIDIVDQYRAKSIPLSAFILDFDFKAWGEDHFGEWRWNSTSAPGNVSPLKYPDGQSGKFAQILSKQNVHLVGIMKPRILTQTVSLQPTEAAHEATLHNWWMPGKKPYKDYFSGRLANDLDFSKPDLRKWYWKHSKGLFDSGIEGWWNDEADDGFDSLGFFHMQQSLFEGQRSVSKRRVWSLNRNFYLGAQRFAFGTWSGDIRTGFKSMADQRARMLATIDLGQPHWSMDTGGFGGHPSPENYARWIEFATVVPIMRVHGTFGELRQPWVYGPVAEAAATKAIRLRYSLQPYLYSFEKAASETGVGIVRPLFWEFPGDKNLATMTDEWMVGDSLLAAPIVDEGQKSKSVYLPAGRWFDYFTDKPYETGTVTIPCDSTNWSDLPLFVKSGSIVATQNASSEKPNDVISLDVWPDPVVDGSFRVYDDDGETRDYERGTYFSQRVTSHGNKLIFAMPTGKYPAPRLYSIKVHGLSSHNFTWNGKLIDNSLHSMESGVATIPAGKAGELVWWEGPR